MFGGEPALEALSAMGLMQFSEMQKVIPFEETVILDLKNWLISRRDTVNKGYL